MYDPFHRPGMVQRAHVALMSRFQQHGNDPVIRRLQNSYIETMKGLPADSNASPHELQYKLDTIHRANSVISNHAERVKDRNRHKHSRNMSVYRSSPILHGGGTASDRVIGKIRKHSVEGVYNPRAEEMRREETRRRTKSDSGYFPDPTSDAEGVYSPRVEEWKREDATRRSRSELGHASHPVPTSGKRKRDGYEGPALPKHHTGDEETLKHLRDLPPAPKSAFKGRLVPPSKKETIAKVQQITRVDLFRQRKLILLVDLDQTVIYSCCDHRGASHIKGTLKLSDEFRMLIRPYLPYFLEMMFERYELVVVTYGTKDYAQLVVQRIDPEKKYFKNRVFSRDEIRSRHSKNEVIGHFGPDVRDMIVAIDDSPDVWPDCEKLMPVIRYSVFYDTMSAFPPNCHIDSLKSRKDIQLDIDTDSHLIDVTNRLMDIHSVVYQPGGRVDPTILYPVVQAFRRVAEIDREAVRVAAEKKLLPVAVPPAPEYVIDEVGKLTRDYLMVKKKLILLCDLDNTLINTTRDALSKYLFPNDVHAVFPYYVRLRPYTEMFLMQMCELYELVAVTMGTAPYAAQILHVLDPSQKFFKNRIFARADFGTLYSKEKILGYFASNVKDMIVILDDSPNVWPTMTPMVCEKYMPFEREGPAAFSPQKIRALRQKPNGGFDFNDRDKEHHKIMPRLIQLHKICYGSGFPYRTAEVAAKLGEWWNNEYKHMPRAAAMPFRKTTR